MKDRERERKREKDDAGDGVRVRSHKVTSNGEYGSTAMVSHFCFYLCDLTLKGRQGTTIGAERI